MKSSVKKAILCMICTLPICGLHATSYASTDVAKTVPVPVKIDANRMMYEGQNGDVEASGDVIVTQGQKQIHTAKLDGNVKSEIYKAPGAITFTDDSNVLQGQNMLYQGKIQHISLNDLEGKVGRYYVRGKNIEYTGVPGREQGIIKDGMVTTENAMAWKTAPDYRVDGDVVTIIPKQKMIIKNAKFYIKNWHFMTIHNYETSLVPNPYGVHNNPFSFMPKPSYKHGRGFGLKGKITYPVSPHTYLFYEYGWYSSTGFKPSYGYAYRGNWGGAEFGYRTEESTVNEEHVWVKKSPELSVYTHPIEVGKTPFILSANANIGHWTEGGIKGSHYMYKGELTHRPIQLGKQIKVTLTGGYQKDYYGYNKTYRTMPYWNIAALYQVSPKFYVTTKYSINKNNGISPYEYDRYEFDKKLEWSTFYRFDRLNAVGIYWAEDLQNHILKYRDVVYYRDLHSFAVELTYKTKQKRVEFKIIAKDF